MTLLDASHRRLGIEGLGEVPWGTHFWLFYTTDEDLLDLLVPYFKAGLEDHEFCLWVAKHLKKWNMPGKPYGRVCPILNSM